MAGRPGDFRIISMTTVRVRGSARSVSTTQSQVRASE